MTKKLVVAWLVAGALDLILAVTLTLIRGGEVSAMLRFVASGPFPAAMDWGAWGSILGVVVHFVLMATMAAAYAVLWKTIQAVREQPLQWGLAYGLLTYVVLDLIVVPLRFPSAWPPKPISILTQMFAHLILVGMVFTLVFSHLQRGHRKLSSLYIAGSSQ